MQTTSHKRHTPLTCDTLGTCQCRLPACSGCTWVASSARRAAAHAFAPGVITAHPSHRLERLRRWARSAYTWGRLALLGALVLVSLAMACGYFVGTLLGGV